MGQKTNPGRRKSLEREKRKTVEKLGKNREETKQTQGGKRVKTKGLKKKKGDEERQNPGKILVPQPARNPCAFTTIVFVLNGEDWAETQTMKKNWEAKLGELD